MIGKHQILIDASNWVKGMSSSANITDGGFSSETDAVNLTYEVGVLHAPADVTNLSANATDNFIASADDPNFNGNDSLYLDDSAAFYTLSGATLTKKVTASGDLFTLGTTDFIFFNGYWLATTKSGANGDIVKWDGNVTLVENWWTSTLSQSALSSTTPFRPLLVYETFLYIGDGNKLHRVSETPTVSNGILTLGTFEKITALGMDKGSGLMMVAVSVSGNDYSATKNSKSKIYLYDGLSAKASKVIPINGTVTAIKQIDDRTIIFVGKKIGYWTGSGIKFLRKLSNIVYQHQATVAENTIYWIEGTKINAYGDVIPGTKVFYPALSNNVNSNSYKSIQHIGAGVLSVSFGDNTPANTKFYTFDTTSVASTGGMTVYSHRYAFPRPITSLALCLEYADAVTDADDTRRLYYKTQEQGNGWQELSVSSSVRLKNNTGASVYFLDDIVGIVEDRIRFIQFKYVTTTNNFGLRRLLAYYDVSD